jgi:hypothetical protein
MPPGLPSVALAAIEGGNVAMNDSSLRTITLNSERLEGAITVLSSAAEDFGLTRRQRILYRVLMISVDLTIACLAVVTVALVGALSTKKAGYDVLGVSGTMGLMVSSGVGVLSLLLNIPLFCRTLRERAKLKALGMTALNKLLWKARRRHNWLRRIRSALIIMFGVLVAFMAGIYTWMSFARGPKVTETLLGVILAAFFALVAVTLFSARHLRNQREQMDLAANADELKEALQNLRQQAGATGTIAVPAELVERAATIESAYIAKERKEAILQSVDSSSSGYAIAFADEAAQQRAALDVADRLELEDLLARLSTEGAPVEPPAGSPAHPLGAASRSTSESGRIEIDYLVGESRGIRVTAVKSLAAEAARAAKGASHA